MTEKDAIKFLSEHEIWLKDNHSRSPEGREYNQKFTEALSTLKDRNLCRHNIGEWLAYQNGVYKLYCACCGEDLGGECFIPQFGLFRIKGLFRMEG